MQRSKFAAGKPLTNLAICRMVRNHLHDVFGWNDGTYPDSETKDLDDSCPLRIDLNGLLTLKRYCQWGRNLEGKGWEVDIHDLIISHAYVLNLDLEPLGDEVLKQFEMMKSLKADRKEIQDQIDALLKKREAIDSLSSTVHESIIKSAGLEVHFVPLPPKQVDRGDFDFE